MTNVKSSELNYDSYSEDKYDLDIINSIPFHKELHEKIIWILKQEFNSKTLEILDLGIGTGITSKIVLEKFPNSQLIGIDFSDQMLLGAQNKLKDFNVELIKEDYSKIDLPKELDLVISVIGFHHQSKKVEKVLMFKKIFASLKQGGIFMLGDLMTYSNQVKASECEQKHFDFLKQNAIDEKTLKEWTHHHKELNKLETVENQIAWLKETGFRKVTLEFSEFNTCLIVAQK
jgi:tRNA (cmo5U34)-methyltransferase